MKKHENAFGANHGSDLQHKSSSLFNLIKDSVILNNQKANQITWHYEIACVMSRELAKSSHGIATSFMNLSIKVLSVFLNIVLSLWLPDLPRSKNMALLSTSLLAHNFFSEPLEVRIMLFLPLLCSLSHRPANDLQLHLEPRILYFSLINSSLR